MTATDTLVRKTRSVRLRDPPHQVNANTIADRLSRQTTQNNIYMQCPQRLFRKLDSKMFLVQNIGTITDMEKYQKSLMNGYERENDLMRIFKVHERRLPIKKQIIVL